jgi:hypothetical protein
MLSKFSLSLAAALALSAAAGVARASPVPTSTDEARAAAGQVTDRLPTTAIEPTNGAVTSSDQARAEAGRSLPAYSGAWVDRMLSRDEGEGRAAAVEGNQGASQEAVEGAPEGSGTAAQSN